MYSPVAMRYPIQMAQGKTRRNVKQKKQKKSKPPQVTTSDMGMVMRGLGALLGRKAGEFAGMGDAGASFGRQAGAGLSYWTGNGDYKVSKNTLLTPNNIPDMHRIGQSVVVRHKEYICPINGSQSFQVQQALVLNPGYTASFPWLATMARKFSEYQIKGMIYHYVPTSGTFSGTGSSLGAVMIQTTYRPTEQQPASKMEMLNEYWATETVACTPNVHAIECDPKENPFQVHYIRNSDVLGADPMMYDLGKTFVATQGMSSTDIVGDLWVTYEIELQKPVMVDPHAPLVEEVPLFQGKFSSNAATTDFFHNGWFTSEFGPSFGISYHDRTLFMPANLPGSFWIVVQFRGSMTGAALAMNDFPTYSNCQGYSINGSTAYGQSALTNSQTVTLNSLTYIFTVHHYGQSSATVVLPPITITGSPIFENVSCIVTVTKVTEL